MKSRHTQQAISTANLRSFITAAAKLNRDAATYQRAQRERSHTSRRSGR